VTDPDAIITQWTILKLTATNIKKEEDISVFWEEVAKPKNRE